MRKIEEKDEYRRYMGSKRAQVPRGAVVKLIAVMNGKTALFDWNGQKFVCPVRLLWKIKK